MREVLTFILAGGKGTRLRPYTAVLPKPLMPIGDYPILEVVIKQLKYYGFNNIIMAVGHLKELIQAFLNNGEKWGVDISCSIEDKPLGTAAPLKLIKDLQDDFLVMNGDILTNLEFDKFSESGYLESKYPTLMYFVRYFGGKSQGEIVSAFGGMGKVGPQAAKSLVGYDRSVEFMSLIAEAQSISKRILSNRKKGIFSND